ncbi:snRNA-activating protein complex subunit isoform X3 [Daucus carota subsp. sativus]|uniref:snRNA-activating protein complex subunit isoform X3 n=1 Tax=Daucus carota subsp. sativus TaxID=79200 RepID=UPI0030828A48
MQTVDELKIVTEEELVDKAFDIAFKDEVTKTVPEVSEKCLDESRTEIGKISETRDNAIAESSKSGTDGACLDEIGISDSSERLCNNSKKRQGRKIKRQSSDRRKRKRDDNQTIDMKRRKRPKKLTVEESYTAKVKELEGIKEEQLEDKAAAKLHSFNGRINDSTMTSSERLDRTTSLKSNNSTAKARISSSREGQVVQPGKEVTLCVEVYHNKRTWQKISSWKEQGSMTLLDISLFENVFCNDLRDTSAIDYSKPILDWLKDSKKEALKNWEYILSGRLQPRQKALVDNKKKEILPGFKAVRMQETQFCELNFRLGAGYLYCHQGDCKHTIVIRDMRLIHPEDRQDRFAYPVVTFQIKPRIRKCSVCQIFRAKLVTVDDKWAEENPCCFCDACYYMLHYSNESLLYPDFSVYDYHHDQI